MWPQCAVSGVSTSDGRWTPAEGFTDIRCDEDYEAFYRAQLEAGRKLPPPLDNRTLYETLPQHVQHGLTKQQQRLLAARMTPSPNGEEVAGSHPAVQSQVKGVWDTSRLYVYSDDTMPLVALCRAGPHQ